jgi:hypothetical protein
VKAFSWSFWFPFKHLALFSSAASGASRNDYASLGAGQCPDSTQGDPVSSPHDLDQAALVQGVPDRAADCERAVGEDQTEEVPFATVDRVVGWFIHGFSPLAAYPARWGLAVT